jgi:hypothetical protein
VRHDRPNSWLWYGIVGVRIKSTADMWCPFSSDVVSDCVKKGYAPVLQMILKLYGSSEGMRARSRGRQKTFDEPTQRPTEVERLSQRGHCVGESSTSLVIGRHDRRESQSEDAAQL